jgi:hypothetical protein
MPVKRRRNPRLRLQSQERRHFIEVPTLAAAGLVVYLRSRGLHVTPPGPSSAGLDSIEILGKNTDVRAVQKLLDRWG